MQTIHDAAADILKSQGTDPCAVSRESQVEDPKPCGKWSQGMQGLQEGFVIYPKAEISQQIRALS